VLAGVKCPAVHHRSYDQMSVKHLFHLPDATPRMIPRRRQAVIHRRLALVWRRPFYKPVNVCNDCRMFNIERMQQLETELKEVEGPGKIPVEDKTPLVCRESHRQVLEEASNVRFFKKLVQIVGAADLIFIIATFFVVTQFVLGNAPKSDVNKIVFVLPIVGTILTSGAVVFLLNRIKAGEKQLEKLTTAFNKACKGVDVD
jgi:hypothetical protein